MNDRFELKRSYRFEAAHFLPRVGEKHPCRRVHGHSYLVTIAVTGEADQDSGWVIDFGSIDECVQPICSRLDHRLLNEVDGLENPTSEMLAEWLWGQLVSHLPGLSEISISETPDSICTLRSTP